MVNEVNNTQNTITISENNSHWEMLATIALRCGIIIGLLLILTGAYLGSLYGLGSDDLGFGKLMKNLMFFGGLCFGLLVFTLGLCTYKFIKLGIKK